MNELTAIKNHVLELMIRFFEKDGVVELALTPRERALVMDALALSSAKVTLDPKSSIFTCSEIDAIGNRITNIK